MTYAEAIAAATGAARPLVQSEAKLLRDAHGHAYPVVFCPARQNRPYQQYQTYTRDNCPLCRRIQEGGTVAGLVGDLQWLPATYPIKSLHGICYPTEHRAAIRPADIVQFGQFADRVSDVVVCVNLRGSAASLPEHFHGQLHDNSLPTGDAMPAGAPAFPLLSRPVEHVAAVGAIAISRVTDYPAFALAVDGPWELLGAWLAGYMAASNPRPHNYALVGGGRLVVIPRGLERAPSQENRYGASEMLGMISPVTREAYDRIDSAAIVEDALAVCGVREPADRLAIEEHAVSVAAHIST
jgi:hypothetical protein